ncbi:MAG: MarR family winged helix-turn-helix transcriptional regulator [Eubacteriales bacterium]|nr:MarR family winged helix-turn-helix transcriptional regulator [Eubacteriales bacterium]
MNYNKTAEELIEKLSVVFKSKSRLSVDGVTKGEICILNYLLAAEGTVFPKQICEIMGISSARVSVVLNHLEARGEIKRGSDTLDKRRTTVILTEKGRAAAIARRNERIIMFASVLESMGEEETKNFYRSLCIFCKAAAEKCRKQRIG